jgi:hypothetical protein
VGRHELIPLARRERWAEALAELPYGHAHTWGFCQAVQLTSRIPTHLYRYERGSARVICPLAERDYDGHVDVLTPYGFGGFAISGDPRAFAHDWAEFAESRGWVCGYVALNPQFGEPRGFAEEEVHAHTSVYVMDLRGTEDEVRARLSQNRRRQLRDWAAAEASLEHDRGRLTEFLLGTYEEFFARRGAGGATDLSSDTMAAIATLDDVLIVGAGEAQLESVALFGHTQHGGDYLFNVSVPGGERHAVHLIWWAVKRLRALGVESLNLGGGIHPGDDLAEFKRRFGAVELPLASLRQVYRPDVYEELCRAAGVTSGRAGWFPPYRASGAAPRRAR